jgi:hypothetical protein
LFAIDHGGDRNFEPVIRVRDYFVFHAYLEGFSGSGATVEVVGSMG